MPPTIIIGDVHGLTHWQDIVHQNPTHHIIFLGDYCDPYQYIDDQDIIDNLWNIISLRQMNPDRVTLLLGNHDMHYLYPDHQFPRGTRYNSDLQESLRTMFTINRQHFQYAHQDGTYLYTHAGISHDWYHQCFDSKSLNPHPTLQQLSHTLNHPTPEQFQAMTQVSWHRGGDSDHGGIFWADIAELQHPLTGIRQIVGHNQVDHIHTTRIDTATSITFADCLKHREIVELNHSTEIIPKTLTITPNPYGAISSISTCTNI